MHPLATTSNEGASCEEIIVSNCSFVDPSILPSIAGIGWQGSLVSTNSKISPALISTTASSKSSSSGHSMRSRWRRTQEQASVSSASLSSSTRSREVRPQSLSIFLLLTFLFWDELANEVGQQDKSWLQGLVLEPAGPEQAWYSFHQLQYPTDVNPVRNYYINYSLGAFFLL